MNPLRSRALGICLALAGLAGGCECRVPPEPVYDASRMRRVFEPAPGEVRAVPPHAIHAAGIGPYVIGTPLKDILDLLPHGPRVVLVEIDGVVDYSLVRTERDSLIIGVQQPYGVAFLTVLDSEIARTESEARVGSSEAELRAAMGAELSAATSAMDPHLLAFDSLPNVRFVLDTREDGGAGGEAKRQVVAVVVRKARASGMSDRERDSPHPSAGARDAGLAVSPASPEAPPAIKPPGRLEGLDGASVAGAIKRSEPEQPGGCLARTALAPLTREIREAARVRPDKRGKSPGRITYGCFSGNQPEALLASAGRLTLIAGERGQGRPRPNGIADHSKLRRVAVYAATGIVFADAVDLDGDGRHEIALITQTSNPDLREVRLELLRVESGRITRMTSRELYRISANSAAWIGAAVADLELLIELDARADQVEVTGLFVQRSEKGLRIVAPLLPKTIPLRRRRPSGATAATTSSGDAGRPRPAGPDARAAGNSAGDAGVAKPR